jgi:LPS-assembly protein
MLLLVLLAHPVALWAQELSAIVIDPLTPETQIEFRGNHTAVGTNGVMVKYENAVLVADCVTVDTESCEATADGHVRIQRDNLIWAGEHIRYHFKSGQMETAEFRLGRPPVFAAGQGLRGEITNAVVGQQGQHPALTNQVYYATNAFITSDDISEPAFRMRAKHLKIIPGRRIEATQAVLYVGDVPVFYFPYYSRNLGYRANNINILPGYRNSYGAFVLGSYRWFLNEQLDGILHVDYREKRGFGGGPDVNYHLGRWGEGELRYYYTHDRDPTTNAVLNAPVHEDRQRLFFTYLATPYTNLEVRSFVRYQSDIGVIHDFFPGEYRLDPQPSTFFDANKFWRNFSLDVLAQPRVDPFYETVERLPDVRLSGFRQQLGGLPLFYESESSAGYYQRRFAETNGPVPPHFEAARADTFQQITLPQTFFGWLNVTPRVGGRFTYYSQAEGPGATTDEESRTVFNTGAEVSLKASRFWPGARSRTFDVDGLRHIIVPSVNYAYVPEPGVLPNQLPQFDYQLPSLCLLPIEFPQYNAIDSIDSQNVLRLGLGNKLQTKRDGQIQNFLAWQVFADWYMRPGTNQNRFGDVYSDLILKPRSWLTLQSRIRIDPQSAQLGMALDTLTIEPNDVWSWSIGQYYLRDDFSSSPTALGPGNSLVTSSIFYRINENWGLRAAHHFDVRTGQMQEQYYSLYRDMRSWTAAVTGGVRNNGSGPVDWTIAFSFSLKAVPSFGLNSDSGRPYALLGE